MKKRVVEKPNVEISIDSITDTSLVGIKWIGRIVLPVKTEDKWIGISLYSFPLDIRCNWRKDSQQDYVKEFLNINADAEAFVFDSKKELKEWIREEI